MEDFMLPCLNKQFFGIDCLGCGFQRATVLLFSGDFTAAFKMYPAIFTLWAFFIFIAISMFMTIKHARKIKLAFALINGIIIVSSYFYKMSFLF